MAIWMVWRKSAFATHYSASVNTYGPFATRKEAEAFIEKGGGTIYDASALSFSERELLGIWS